MWTVHCIACRRCRNPLVGQWRKAAGRRHGERPAGREGEERGVAGGPPALRQRGWRGGGSGAGGVFEAADAGQLGERREKE